MVADSSSPTPTTRTGRRTPIGRTTTARRARRLHARQLVEGAGWIDGVACNGVRQVVALEDRGDELAAAVHARPVEHRLQVILHGVGGQVQPARYLAGRQALADQRGYRLLTISQAIGGHDQRRDLSRGGVLDYHGNQL